MDSGDAVFYGGHLDLLVPVQRHSDTKPNSCFESNLFRLDTAIYLCFINRLLDKGMEMETFN